MARATNVQTNLLGRHARWKRSMGPPPTSDGAMAKYWEDWGEVVIVHNKGGEIELTLQWSDGVLYAGPTDHFEIVGQRR